jgi:hypothetical protein
MIEKYFKLAGVRLKWTFPGDDSSGIKDGSIIANPDRPASPMIYDGMDGELTSPGSPHASMFGLTMGMQIPYRWLFYSVGHTTKTDARGRRRPHLLHERLPDHLWTDK